LGARSRTSNLDSRFKVLAFFLLVSSHPVFSTVFQFTTSLFFILFWLVLDQSGSNMVTSQRREARLNPQIASLIARKKVTKTLP